MAKQKKSTVAKVSKTLVALRRRLKRDSGEKPFAEWWADYKAEGKVLEEAKYQRCCGR